MVPKGTSEYQAAWIIDSEDDENESDEDSDEEAMSTDEEDDSENDMEEMQAMEVCIFGLYISDLRMRSLC